MKRQASQSGDFFTQEAALSPVQRHGGEPENANVHAAADHGISGGGGALPFAAQIQQSFGGYDISNVQAHTDSAAAQANAAMGADAYATGNDIAFGGAPDLHTAAHEAAHVVQQQSGVQLSGGVGKVGDPYEVHADKVADAVVQGKSAEPILGEMTGGKSGGAVQQKAVQRRVWVGAAKETEATFVVPPAGLSEKDRAALSKRSMLASEWSAEETWGLVWIGVCEHLQVNPELVREGIELQVKAKFLSWVNERSGVENARYSRPEGKLQSPERAAAENAASTGANAAPAAPAAAAEQAESAENAENMTSHTELRVYPLVESLALALIHESHPEYADRIAVETALAMKVAADAQYANAVRGLVSRLAGRLSIEDQEALEMLASESRYKAFSSLPKTKAILAGGGDIGEAIIFLDEYNNYWPNKSAAFEVLKQDMKSTFGDFRVNGYTVKEENEWVKEARALGAPLMAGPSGTTNNILALGASLGLDTKNLYRVAWCMHAFFNGMWRGQSGTHRLHEVMAVAKAYCGADFTYYPSMKEL